MKKLSFFIFLITCCLSTIQSQDKIDTTKIQEKVTSYRIGKAVVTVIEKQRQGKYGEFTAKDFKVEKIYKKGDNWESTNTFDLTELLQLRAVIDKVISEESVKIKDELDNDYK
jgi:hypothetical protein